MSVKPENRALVGKRARWLLDFFARPCPRPIFVMGNQKSGTSAIAALLGKATGKSVAIDIARDFKKPAFHLVGKEISFADYRRRNALEFSRQIIKEANLTPMFSEIKSVYKDASYVFVVRDPRTNIRSILQRLGLPGRPWEATPADLEKLSQTWRLILDSGWLGVEGSDYVERLAGRWRLFSDIATANAEHFHFIRYEDFLVDKKGVIERLSRRLSLEPKYDIAEAADIQYQGRGDHSIAVDEFFDGYGLDQITAICAQGMEYFDYKGDM